MELRNKAMKDRLEHLYAMHAINVQLQDRVAIQEDDDPFMEDEREPAQHANDDRSLTKKEEGDDLLVKSEDQHSHHPAHSPQVQDNHHHQLRSHINGSPPLSSSPTHGSPGPFHRHWKENIVGLGIHNTRLLLCSPVLMTCSTRRQIELLWSAK